MVRTSRSNGADPRVGAWRRASGVEATRHVDGGAVPLQALARGRSVARTIRSGQSARRRRLLSYVRPLLEFQWGWLPSFMMAGAVGDPSVGRRRSGASCRGERKVAVVYVQVGDVGVGRPWEGGARTVVEDNQPGDGVS